MAPAQRIFLESLFRTAVAAAHPSSFLGAHLPAPPAGKLVILAAGKAGGSMAEAAERHYLDGLHFPPDRIIGAAVARHGYGRPTRLLTMIEAGHPVPDAAGLQAAERALAFADAATRNDLVLVLMSGGASANWIAPADGISFADKQAVTRALLRSGAVIGEINTVRKHLSRIKGGRLAQHAYPARVVTLAISDVPGDEPTAIRYSQTRSTQSCHDLQMPCAPPNKRPAPPVTTALRLVTRSKARPERWPSVMHGSRGSFRRKASAW